jgi:hypothetical protein
MATTPKVLRNTPRRELQFRVLPKQFARFFQIQLGFKKKFWHYFFSRIFR